MFEKYIAMLNWLIGFSYKTLQILRVDLLESLRFNFVKLACWVFFTNMWRFFVRMLGSISLFSCQRATSNCTARTTRFDKSTWHLFLFLPRFYLWFLFAYICTHISLNSLFRNFFFFERLF